MIYWMLFLVPVIILPGLTHNPRFLKVFLFSAAVFAITYMIARRQKFQLSINLKILIPTLLMAPFMIQLFLLGNPLEAVYHYSLIFFPWFLIALSPKPLPSETSLMKALIASGLFVSGIGILNYYNISPLQLSLTGPFSKMSIISTIGNPNYVSNFLASIIWVLGYSVFHMKDKLWKTLALLSFFSSLLVFFWCQTRTVYLAFAISGLVYLIWLVFSKKLRTHFAQKKTWVMIALVACVAVWFWISPPGRTGVSSPFQATVQRTADLIVDFDDPEGDWYHRRFIWRIALEMYKEQPLFGTGLGAYRLLSTDYQPRITQNDSRYYGYFSKPYETHSDYLEMLAETGVLGTILWGGMLIYLVVAGIRKIKRSSNPLELAMFCGVLTILVHAITEFPFHMMPSLAVFAVFGMYLLQDGPKKRLPSWVVATLILTMISLLYVQFRWVLGNAQYAQSQVQHEKSNYLHEEYRVRYNTLQRLEEHGLILDLSEIENDWAFSVDVESVKSNLRAQTQRVYRNHFFTSSQRLWSDLIDSRSLQLSLALGAAISLPSDYFIVHTLATTIRQLEDFTSEIPPSRIDLQEYRPSRLSTMIRNAPSRMPDHPGLLLAQDPSARTQIDSLYLAFHARVLALQAPMDPYGYLFIGRTALDLLNKLDELEILDEMSIEQEALWWAWIDYAYKQAIQLKGADDKGHRSSWNQIDFEYLETLLMHDRLEREHLLESLAHRQQLAQYTLSQNWVFPSRYYLFMRDMLEDSRFSHDEQLIYAFSNTFTAYQSFYQMNQERLDKERENALDLRSSMSLEAREHTLFSLEMIAVFLDDFSSR